MGKHNVTALSEFIRMGITDRPELQAPLFGLFLLIYMISVVGNLGMAILTKVDSRLQTPMYFFLRHLSLTDLGYSIAVGPKMLVSFVVDENKVSYYFCATQVAFFIIFFISELFILSAMAYDCYVGICHPLLYTVMMSPRLWHILVVIPYLYSVTLSLLTVLNMFTSLFCSSNVIRYFYCSSLSLIALLCSDTQEIKLIILTFSTFNLVSSLLTVLVRNKAFSTCGSQLTAIIVFYGTLFFMYLQPKSSESFNTDKVASLFYTLVIPMLNPMIYSLRNKEVKNAVYRTWTIENSFKGPDTR
uniref:G-protein coupled receptors family 1 profile domain-containing protein n=1 Tax=Catagonus wagneri TaxID=51154 RepID=A0A8C3WAG9_9CETA